ncbi:MAG TPA: c-type cytochrome [Steroidobacter sp.]|uniref:c-type cytochrome n=1 Tax=Steroidobacter sp. TaxID=1978227 RepID=UPI002ED857BF
MSMLARALMFAGMALSLSIPAASAEEIDFSYCAVCHGANGNGNPAIRAPKIAGMEAWYLKRQLQSFRAGLRGAHPDDAAGGEMRPMAVHLRDDAAIDQAVAHVASFVPKTPPATISGDTARGKQIYETCASCHGSRAEGNAELNAPALAGRTDWYLVTQLKNYMTGLRGAQARDIYGAQMRAVAAALPDDQAANDVVAYINTLR